MAMDETTNLNAELDPHLEKLLKAYATIPGRDRYAAGRTRAKFLHELNKSFADPDLRGLLRGWMAASVWASRLTRLKASWMPFIQRRAVMYTMVTLMIVAAVLFSGVGISAYAASSSLPGDAMYPLKTDIETVRARLTGNAESRARLYLSFAGKRLDDMQSLIDAGRYDDLALGANEFESQIQMALIAAESVSDDDPTVAAALHTEIMSILQNYNITLIQMLIVLPPDVQPIIVQVIVNINIVMSDDDDGDFGQHPGDDDNDSDDDSETQKATSTPAAELTATPAVPTATPTFVPSVTPGSGNGSDNDDDDDDDDDGDDDDDDYDDDDSDDDDG
jgi:hypothetical protein